MTELVRPLRAPLDRPIRLGVLLSGSGTTMVNFCRQIESGRLSAEIVQVIASRPDCSGIQRAQEYGLPVEVIARRDYESVEDFSRANFDCLDQAGVDLVTLAGYLALLQVPDSYRLRVMNIHPSLIPAFCGHGFYGHRVHEAAIDRGVRISGCTVHFADNQYDHGPIILQRCVEIPDGETPEGLARRVFVEECEAYPEAIRLFASGRLIVDGRRISLREPT